MQAINSPNFMLPLNVQVDNLRNFSFDFSSSYAPCNFMYPFRHCIRTVGTSIHSTKTCFVYLHRLYSYWIHSCDSNYRSIIDSFRCKRFTFFSFFFEVMLLHWHWNRRQHNKMLYNWRRCNDDVMAMLKLDEKKQRNKNIKWWLRLFWDPCASCTLHLWSNESKICFSLFLFRHSVKSYFYTKKKMGNNDNCCTYSLSLFTKSIFANLANRIRVCVKCRAEQRRTYKDGINLKNISAHPVVVERMHWNL